MKYEGLTARLIDYGYTRVDIVPSDGYSIKLLAYFDREPDFFGGLAICKEEGFGCIGAAFDDHHRFTEYYLIKRMNRC